jgi:hypothetical protein
MHGSRKAHQRLEEECFSKKKKKIIKKNRETA